MAEVVVSRKDRLAQLKNRRIHAQTENRNDTRVEASKPMDKAPVREARVIEDDDERVKSLSYTIQDQEKWNEKLAEKAERDQPGFSTYDELAKRKFTRLSKDIKPNHELYVYTCMIYLMLCV
jgi:pre-mRNA-splicing factor SYF2